MPGSGWALAIQLWINSLRMSPGGVGTHGERVGSWVIMSATPCCVGCCRTFPPTSFIPLQRVALRVGDGQGNQQPQKNQQYCIHSLFKTSSNAWNKNIFSFLRKVISSFVRISPSSSPFFFSDRITSSRRLACYITWYFQIKSYK